MKLTCCWLEPYFIIFVCICRSEPRYIFPIHGFVLSWYWNLISLLFILTRMCSGFFTPLWQYGSQFLMSLECGLLGASSSAFYWPNNYFINQDNSLLLIWRFKLNYWWNYWYCETLSRLTDGNFILYWNQAKFLFKRESDFLMRLLIGYTPECLL